MKTTKKFFRKHWAMLGLGVLAVLFGDPQHALPLVGGFFGHDLHIGGLFKSKPQNRNNVFRTDKPPKGRGWTTSQSASGKQGTYRKPSGGGRAPAGVAPGYGDAYGGGAPAGPSQADIDAANRAEKNTLEAARQSSDTLYQSYLDKTLPFARTVETGQTGINTGRVNNALNLRRSRTMIGGDIASGVRSGGVHLANANALNSGAAAAMAMAYAKQGGKQFNQASNQAALKGGEFDTSQTSLDQQVKDTLRSLSLYRKVEARRIFRNLEQKLQALEQEDPGNVIDPSADWKILDEANERLNKLDSELKQRLNAANPLTPDEIAAKAYEADLAGKAANPFGYDPTNVQAPGGPPMTQIPFALARPRTDEETPTFAPDQFPTLPNYDSEYLGTLGLNSEGDPPVTTPIQGPVTIQPFGPITPVTDISPSDVLA